MKNHLFVLTVLAFFGSCTQQEVDIPDNPTWAEGIVWYQIFPERFNDGDPTNQPNQERARGPEGWEPTSWTNDWYSRDEWESNHTPNFYDIVRERRYGGDLQGVINKLDYLKDLGVGGIYFNPIFDAQSMHKYDATYYHHIDRNFGPNPTADVAQFERENPGNSTTWEWTAGDKLFLELIEEAHKRDMKVVIDGVFNHTGTEFWAFQDLVEKQENSAYKDWYIVTSFDDPSTEENEFDYEGWWGFKGLPVFREENENLMPETKAHIFEITKRWMDPNGDGDPSDGVDGWRLDVASEVGKNFWRDWHAFVRKINPAAVTIAEIWTDEAKDFIAEDMFSSVMNYRFTDAVKLYLIDEAISGDEFVERLTQVLEDYPVENADLIQNLMDSHDTARLSSSIINKGKPYNPDSYPDEHYEVRKPNEDEIALQKLVALFQYTWKGAPMIYYGTEAGMWGADDPDDRKPMIWQEYVYENEISHPYGWERPADSVFVNRNLLEYYRSLGLLRVNTEVLKRGDVSIMEINDDAKLLTFLRTIPGYNNIFVVINRSDEVQNFDAGNCFLGNQIFGTSPQPSIDAITPMSGAVYEAICR